MNNTETTYHVWTHDGHSVGNGGHVGTIEEAKCLAKRYASRGYHEVYITETNHPYGKRISV